LNVTVHASRRCQVTWFPAAVAWLVFLRSGVSGTPVTKRSLVTRASSAARGRADDADADPHRGPKTAHRETGHHQVPSQARCVVKYTSAPFCLARTSIRAAKANSPTCSQRAAEWRIGPGRCAQVPRVAGEPKTPGEEGAGRFHQKMLASKRDRQATPAVTAGRAGAHLPQRWYSGKSAKFGREFTSNIRNGAIESTDIMGLLRGICQYFGVKNLEIS